MYQVRAVFLGFVCFCGSFSIFAEPGPTDVAVLNMIQRTDPNVPAPEVGLRWLSMRFNPDPTWGDFESWLVVAKSQMAAEADPFQPYGWPLDGPDAERYVVQLQPDFPGTPVRVSHILKHRRHGLNGDTQAQGATGYDFFKDESVGYYRWTIRHRVTPTDPWTVLDGDVHAFVVPRRLVVALMGDSFGSGEGAPSMAGNPWSTTFLGTLGRRSAISGQNLAVTAFGAPFDIAFDVINVTSSGAIAEDLYSNRSQFWRPEKNPVDPVQKGVWYPQVSWLRTEMTRRGYHTVDAAILSIGGNDLGFANLVGSYLGATEEEMLAVLFTAALSLRLLEPFTQLFSGLQDFSIYSDYPGGYPGGFVPVRLPRMLNRLQGEYAKLALELARVPTGASWQVNKVGVTEYPNPMLDTTTFNEMVPLLRFSGLPPDWLGDLFDISYPIKVSHAEGTEINNILIPPLFVPQPPGGGFNHAVRDAVNLADALSPNTTWSLIGTRAHQNPRTGLAWSGREFNTLRDAAFLDRGRPDERRNHSVHPNHHGHQNIYRPAILNYLLNELDVLYRRDAASHLKPPSIGERDLVCSVRANAYNAATRELSVSLYVENRGSISAPATEVVLRMEPVGLLGTVTIPPLADKSSHSQSVTLTVPTHPQFALHRFYCKDSFLFYPGFEFYQDRDATLAFFFPRRWALEAEVDPENLIAESSEANNRAVSPTLVEIPPTVAQATLDAVLLELELAVPGYGGPPLDTAMLMNSDILSFFGYYSTFVNLFVNGNPPQPGEMETLANSLLVPALTAAGLEAPPEFEFGVTNSLRPICLFANGDLVLLASDKTTRGRRAVYDGADLVGLTPRDGRPSQVTGRFTNEDGTFEMDSVTTLPVERAGIPTAVDGATLEQIENQPIQVPIQVPIGIDAVRVFGGTLPASADLFDFSFRNPAEIGALLSLPRVPQDGRDFFLTIQSLIEAEWENEHYWYTTPLRRAPLRAPEPDQGVPASCLFQWKDVPADGFRLFVGSYPGSADLFPGAPLSPERLEQASVEPHVLELQVDDLPRDGRPIHISLFTLIDGEWEEEQHVRRAESAENGNLTFPAPGSFLGARVHFCMAPGSGAGIVSHRLRLGGDPGGDDLFDSGLLPPGDLEPLEVLLPAPAPQMIFATFSTYRDPGMEEEQEVYPFFRTTHASLLEPSSDEPLPPAVTSVQWQAGHEGVVAYRLRVYVQGIELPILDQTHGPGILQSHVDLTPFAGESVMIQLDTQDADGWHSDRVFYRLASAVSYDYSADDLPPFWQLLHFGPDNPLAHPDADPDGDGCSNRYEYLTGTDPNNPDDCMRPAWQLVGGVSRYVLPAAYPTTGYRQEGTQNLAATAWSASPEYIPVAYTTNAVLDRAITPGAGEESFRLRIMDRRPKE